MQPNSDETELRRKEYASIRERLLAGRQANYENLDRAILSLASGGLGLSIAFFKDIVPIKEATFLAALYTSWICLAATIIANLASFWVGQAAHDLRLVQARRYFIDRDDRAWDEDNSFSTWTEYLNRTGIVLFAAAVISSIAFVTANVTEIRQRGDSRVNTSGQAISQSEVNPVPAQKEIPGYEKRGIIPPKIDPLPTRPPSTPPPQQDPTEPPSTTPAQTPKN